MSSLAKRIGIIEKLKKELNEIQGMLSDALENDSHYQEAREKQQGAARDANLVKSQVMNEPANAKLVGKQKELRQEMAEEKRIMAQELAVYFSKEGRSEIELEDGTKFTFKLSASLFRRGE